MKRTETKKSESSDKTKGETALLISFVNKFSSRRIFEELETFFINVSNIMIKLLNVNDDSDRDDCTTSEDSKTMSEGVNEEDDEIRSKKKSTKIAL
jgi:hypothetical protein